MTEQDLKQIVYTVLVSKKTYNLNPAVKVVTDILCDPANKKLVLDAIDIEKVKEILKYNKRHK